MYLEVWDIGSPLDSFINASFRWQKKPSLLTTRIHSKEKWISSGNIYSTSLTNSGFVAKIEKDRNWSKKNQGVSVLRRSRLDCFVWLSGSILYFSICPENRKHKRLIWKLDWYSTQRRVLDHHQDKLLSTYNALLPARVNFSCFTLPELEPADYKKISDCSQNAVAF